MERVLRTYRRATNTLAALPDDGPRFVLVVAVALWVIVLANYCTLRYRTYGTFGFDLGIYDQGIWLLSRFQDPFVTIRGLPLLAHHFNAILVALVPLYWIAPHPLTLLAVQLGAQVAAVIGVFVLARDRIGDRWLATALAIAMLLNPAWQIMASNWFHPDVLAVAPLIFAVWAAHSARWRLFAAMILLALAMKEDVVAAVFGIGLFLLVRRETRRAGLATCAAAVAWYFAVARLVIPALNHGQPPQADAYFAPSGSTPFRYVVDLIVHPSRLVDLLWAPDRRTYVWQTFAPVAFVSALAPLSLLIALPAFFVNIASVWPYQRGLGGHYSAILLAGVFVAVVEAVARLRSSPRARSFVTGMVLAGALASTATWGIVPGGGRFREAFGAARPTARTAALDAAVARIPPGAPTSASYYVVTHLTHREKIYEFPVPWRAVNWGLHDDRLDDPADVQWLLVDRTTLSPDDDALLDRLLEREFHRLSEQNGLVLARRVAAP